MPSNRVKVHKIRYTHEVSEIVEAQPGESLNDKFENLVKQCRLEMPEIEKKIAVKEQYLKSLEDQVERMKSELAEVEVLKARRTALDRMLGDVERYCSEYWERLKQKT